MKVLPAFIFAALATNGACFNCPLPTRFGVRLTTTSLQAIVDGEDKGMSRRDVLQGLAYVSPASFLIGGKAAYAAEYAQTWLTDPTEEFKANEEKAIAFKRAQLQVKKKFTDVLNRLTNESKTEADIVRDLNDLRELVVATGGLPLGIKKEAVYKTIRAKKRLSWSTNSEIAYQDLIREIIYQQSPNTDKDLSNYTIG